MDLLHNYALGFGVVLQWQNLLAIPVGVLVGLLVGAMPGLSASIGVALLVPFTYGMDASASLLLLVSLYCGGEYGGSITAISINTPGTPAAAATAIDGYACTKKGIPGKALGTSIIASTCGGIISTVFLMMLAFPITAVAMKFGPAEYFALGIFGLTTIASLSGKFWIKGFIAALIGLILRTVGMDSITSFERFTFGVLELLEGISFIPALIGCFAMSEVFMMIEEVSPLRQTIERFSSRLPNWVELKDMITTILTGSFIGTFIGAVPGAGASIACWISLDQVKRFSKDKDKFGTGILKGVAAPESANNATIGGALIPLLTLGIPGSATTAVLIGAFMLQGLEPGPRLFVTNPDLVYGMFVGLMVANVWMLIFGLIGTKLWVRVIETPKSLLAPMIVVICFIGSYAVANSPFDIGLMLAFGFGSYILRKLGFPVITIVLALVLGHMVEANFRRALLQSAGSYMIFLTHPICLVLLILAVFFFFFPFLQEWMATRREKALNNS
jgi:putative tricarboxylic transport membrane protein